MDIKPKDIGSIEVYSVDGFGSKYCFGRAMLNIAEDSHMEDPHFEKIIFTKVRCQGNEVTFKVDIKNAEESEI